MLWELFLAAVVIATLYSRWKNKKFHELHEKLASDVKPYPLVGHAYLFMGNSEDRMNGLMKIARETYKSNKGFVTGWMGPKLYGVIVNPEIIEVVTKSCLEKDDVLKYIRDVLGNGIIFAPVNIWRTRRKIMAPAFNMINIKRFVNIFDKQSLRMTNLLQAQAGRGEFSIWKYVTTNTFDSICETAIGIKLNSQEQPDHPFLESFQRMTYIVTKRILSPWLYYDWVFKLTPHYYELQKHKRVLRGFCDELIRDKRKELSERHETEIDDDTIQKTFLEMLIEGSGGETAYTNIELREEVMAIVMAGTDTTAVGTSFTILVLSRYPDVQEKVYQEIQEVFGGSDRPVTWEDLQKLKYMDIVIKEVLRLYPPVAVIMRDVLTPVTLPDGTELLPGMGLLLHIWGMHHNPEYWGEDADEFRPERFLEPLKHPAQFVPFSYSIRRCIGNNYVMMTTKTVLANLLRRFIILPPSNVDPDKMTEMFRTTFDIMIKDVDDFVVRLENRPQSKINEHVIPQ